MCRKWKYIAAEVVLTLSGFSSAQIQNALKYSNIIYQNKKPHTSCGEIGSVFTHCLAARIGRLNFFRFRISPLNAYKDKKLIAVNRSFNSNFFAIQCWTCRSFHARLKCLDISIGHSALFDSGHLRLRFKASSRSCYPAIVALSATW